MAALQVQKASESLSLENYHQKLMKLTIESEVLLANRPINNLKINKNKIQLINLIKKHNEKYKISLDDIPKNYFRLTQLGVKCNQIDQLLTMEKYQIDKKKSDEINEEPSYFAAPMKSELDLGNYLQKHQEFSLYNKVDAIINNPKGHYNTSVRDWIFETYMNKTIEHRKMMQIQRKNFSFLKKMENLEIPSSAARLGVKSMGLDGRMRDYARAIEKWLYMGERKKGLGRMIEEFADINSNNSDCQRLWNILSFQVKAATSLPSSSSSVQSHVLAETCKLLEFEFFNELTKLNSTKVSFGKIRTNDPDLSAKLNYAYSYIEANYKNIPSLPFLHSPSFPPIFAILYTFFRAGLHDDMLKTIKCFLLESKEEERILRFAEALEVYIRSCREEGMVGEEERRKMMRRMEEEEGGDVFEYMMYAMMVGSGDVPSEDLVKRIADYLWMKLCCHASLRPSSSSLNLEEFQQLVLSHGSQSLDPGNKNPLFYVKTLFLILCHEEAMKHLSSFENFQIDLVHFLIVIRESGLVEEERKLLNITEVIYNYILGFVNNHPMEAMQYLRLLPKKEMIKIMTNVIVDKELIDFFFGIKQLSITTNFKKITDLLGLDDTKLLVIEIIKSIRSTNVDYALRLFDLIGETEKVVQLILEYEAAHLSKKKKIWRGEEEGIRNTINLLVGKYRNERKFEGINDGAFFNQTLMLVNHLEKIRLLTESNNYEHTFKQIKEKKLLPLYSQENDQHVNREMKYYLIIFLKNEYFATFVKKGISSIYLELLLIFFETLIALSSRPLNQLTKLKENPKELKEISTNIYFFYQNKMKKFEGQMTAEKDFLKELDILSQKITFV